MRTVITFAALAAVVAAGPADARTYCHLVREKPGAQERPERALARGATPFGPYDLKSADYAANATHLTVVARVADLANDSPLASEDGALYDVAFSRDWRNSWFLRASVSGERAGFSLWRDDVSALWEPGSPRPGPPHPPILVTRDVTGVVDRSRDEVRMTVALAAFGPGVLRRGTVLRYLAAQSISTKVHTGTSGSTDDFVFGQTEDVIEGGWYDEYPLGAPSCVRVGR